MILQICKTVVSWTAAAGVGTVTKNLVKMSTPAVMSKKEEILMKVGGVMLPLVLGAATSAYVEGIFDGCVTAVKTLQEIETVLKRSPEENTKTDTL